MICRRRWKKQRRKKKTHPPKNKNNNSKKKTHTRTPTHTQTKQTNKSFRKKVRGRRIITGKHTHTKKTKQTNNNNNRKTATASKKNSILLSQWADDLAPTLVCHVLEYLDTCTGSEHQLKPVLRLVYNYRSVCPRQLKQQLLDW